MENIQTIRGLLFFIVDQQRLTLTIVLSPTRSLGWAKINTCTPHSKSLKKMMDSSLHQFRS